MIHGMQFYYIFTYAVESDAELYTTMPTILKKCLLIILNVLIFLSEVSAQKTYELISKKTGKVNINTAADLSIELKALAALYSAMGGTDCLQQECVLTTALGLGLQGSEEQKNLIKKYFPDDKVASLLLGQECYLPPGSSSSFSNFFVIKYFSKRT
ncbi:MAG: hypothetical protein WDM78_05260 [Puia sp.]